MGTTAPVKRTTVEPRTVGNPYIAPLSPPTRRPPAVPVKAPDLVPA